jgi:hypothetical protein
VPRARKTACARGACWALLGGPSTFRLADMTYDGVKRLSALGAVGAAVVLATYDGWLTTRHLIPNEHLFRIYRFVLSALLATWLVTDAQERKRERPTFDHGGFALFLFFLYAPYYLVSTRRIRGVLIFAGIVLLFLLPLIAELIASHVS